MDNRKILPSFKVALLFLEIGAIFDWKSNFVTCHAFDVLECLTTANICWTQSYKQNSSNLYDDGLEN